MRVQVDVVRLSAVCLALALGVSMTGCKKEGGTEAPSSYDRAGDTAAGNSSDPVAELAALEGRMRTLGLPVAADKRERTETAEGEDDVAPAEPEGGGGETQSKLAEETAPPTPSAQMDATSESRDESIDYCGDLCSLSESICTLEVRICSLAKAHADDTVYADACERAVEDCDVAGEACDSCG